MLLLSLFLVPLVASIVLFSLPLKLQRSGKPLALIFSLIPLLQLIFFHSNWIGSSENYAWATPLSVNFHLNVDSLTLIFLYLTAIIIPLSIVATSESSAPRLNVYYGFALLLESLLIVFFMARDLVVFTIFWEAMLLPLFFIIALFGGKKRFSAALKFLVYMIAGSALMIAAVLSLHFAVIAAGGASTFDFSALSSAAESAPHASLLFAIFLLAFAVKTPLFPFHAWLPDAYCQAPSGGTILLSAILSKAGIYGILRIGMGFFPNLMAEWSYPLLWLAIIGVLYGGLAAYVQTDFKRLLAYSSFSHVNFILVGIFALNQTAEAGAILQSINHAVTIAALFLVAFWLEERLQTTAFSKFKGVAKYFPTLCWLTLFFVLSSVALPGLNNFVGELLIFFGLFGAHPFATALVGCTVILSVIYMLRWMQKIYFESPNLESSEAHAFIGQDIGLKELLIALPLIFITLWIGIYPSPVLKITEESLIPITNQRNAHAVIGE